MTLRKTRDGFVFDDDLGEAVVIDYHVSYEYSISVVWHAKLRGWRDSKNIYVLLRLTKAKEYAGECWDEGTISGILEEQGFRVHNVQINKTRNLLSAEIEFERPLDIPVPLHKDELVAHLHNWILRFSRWLLQKLSVEDDNRRTYVELDIRLQDAGLVEWEGFEEGSITDWWEEYYGGEEL